jgi:hypothetical protein
MLMGCLLPQHGVGGGYGSKLWKVTVMLNGRRVIQTLFTKFDVRVTVHP